jgi:hypothetical protein
MKAERSLENTGTIYPKIQDNIPGNFKPQKYGLENLKLDMRLPRNETKISR